MKLTTDVLEHTCHRDLNRRDADAFALTNAALNQHFVAVQPQNFNLSISESVGGVDDHDLVFAAKRGAGDHDDVIYHRAKNLRIHKESDR